MTLCVTLRTVYPRWAKSYLEMMRSLAEIGVDVDQDAVIARVLGATTIEIIDCSGNRSYRSVGAGD